MIHETSQLTVHCAGGAGAKRLVVKLRGCAAPQADTGAYAALYRNFFSGDLDIRPFPPDPSTGLLGGLPSDSC